MARYPSWVDMSVNDSFDEESEGVTPARRRLVLVSTQGGINKADSGGRGLCSGVSQRGEQ